MAKTRVALVSLDKDLIDLILDLDDLELVGVFDISTTIDALGAPHLGRDDAWNEFHRRHPDVKVILGIDPAVQRRRLAAQYGLEHLLTVRSATAHVSRFSTLGPGCVIQRDVVIMPGVEIDVAAKLNIGATVHHDCHVGAYCTLAPGCRLLGNVVLGEAVYVGAGAVLLPRVSIGSAAVIGAGAVVTKNVAPGATVIGVPARPMR